METSKKARDPSRGGEEEERVPLSLTFAVRNGRRTGTSRAASVFEKFEVKIHHLESRAAKAPKNLADDDLDFFVKCEVLSSEVSSLVNSLKRVAENVKTHREEKGV
ncbi:UNVERIFIED_CONTAM: hypothetical protein K2H54_074852 [Gekko kuhli]